MEYYLLTTGEYSDYHIDYLIAGEKLDTKTIQDLWSQAIAKADQTEREIREKIWEWLIQNNRVVYPDAETKEKFLATTYYTPIVGIFGAVDGDRLVDGKDYFEAYRAIAPENVDTKTAFGQLLTSKGYMMLNYIEIKTDNILDKDFVIE
jgi:hypothetical protein